MKALDRQRLLGLTAAQLARGEARAGEREQAEASVERDGLNRCGRGRSPRAEVRVGGLRARGAAGDRSPVWDGLGRQGASGEESQSDREEKAEHKSMDNRREAPDSYWNRLCHSSC